MQTKLWIGLLEPLHKRKASILNNHILSIFGGAGAQHGWALAWALARSLGIRRVFIHKYCGILSAYGMGLANVIEENEIPYSCTYNTNNVKHITK